MKYCKKILAYITLSIAIAFGAYASNSTQIVEGEDIVGMTCSTCNIKMPCFDNITGNTGCVQISGNCTSHRNCGQNMQQKCETSISGRCTDETDPKGCGQCMNFTCGDDKQGRPCAQLKSPITFHPGGKCQ